jgi:hypothetical protein
MWIGIRVSWQFRCDVLAIGNSRSSPARTVISSYPFSILEQVDFWNTHDIGLLAGYGIGAAVEAHQFLCACRNSSIPF